MPLDKETAVANEILALFRGEKKRAVRAFLQYRSLKHTCQKILDVPDPVVNPKAFGDLVSYLRSKENGSDVIRDIMEFVNLLNKAKKLAQKLLTTV